MHKNGYIKSLNNQDPNCKYTLKDYYIKTAYNCCSLGGYKDNNVNICVLKEIIRQGVRALDFEIYSVDNKPVVATSTTDDYFVKETYNQVPFSQVMETIQNYAFSGGDCPNPNDPIILHLRIKSNNQKMFQNLADLFKHYDDLFLGAEYSFESNGTNVGDVNLLDLNRKIILVVDKSNNSFMDNRDLYEYVNITSNSVFMRATTFYNVKNTPDMVELQEYNKRNMTIVLPDNGRDPANPSGIVSRAMGCQMVAMRYNKFDTNLDENNEFFNETGYAFVLKPESLRFVPIVIPDPTPPDPKLSYAKRTITADYYAFDI
jgi:hypothetical protein